MLLISTQISAVPAGTEPSETSSSCSGLYYSMAEYSQSIHLEFFVWEQQRPLSDDATHQGFGTGQDGNELSLSRGTSTRTLTSTNLRMRVPRYKLVGPFTILDIAACTEALQCNRSGEHYTFDGGQFIHSRRS